MLVAANQRALLYASLTAGAVTILVDVLLGPFDPDPAKAQLRYIAPIAFNVGGSVIAALGWLHARGMGGARRTAVRLFALGMGGYMFGQWLWLGYNLEGIDVPYPSLADVGYLMLPATAIAGALILLRTTRRRILGVDIALLFAFPVTTFLIFYAFLIQPRFDAGQNLLRTIVDLAYPTADAFYVALAGALIQFTRVGPLTPAIRRLSAAMILMAVTDVIWIVGLDKGFYFTGSWIDILYIVAASAFGWSILQFPVEGSPRTATPPSEAMPE